MAFVPDSQSGRTICFTGDYVTYNRGIDRNGLFRLLRRAADNAPSYAVLGNHDGGAWMARRGGSPSSQPMADLVTSAGIRLLHNRAAVEGDMTLVGVGDYWSGELDAQRAFAEVPASPATIVLCHNPDGKEELARLPWNLMLSGHTHGGQARIPGFCPTWAPVSDKRFIAGLYSWSGRQLFITRGLGSPKHVRAFCRPEVSMLHLA